MGMHVGRGRPRRRPTWLVDVWIEKSERAPGVSRSGTARLSGQVSIQGTWGLGPAVARHSADRSPPAAPSPGLRAPREASKRSAAARGLLPAIMPSSRRPGSRALGGKRLVRPSIDAGSGVSWSMATVRGAAVPLEPQNQGGDRGIRTGRRPAPPTRLPRDDRRRGTGHAASRGTATGSRRGRAAAAPHMAALARDPRSRRRACGGSARSDLIDQSRSDRSRRRAQAFNRKGPFPARSVRP